MPKPQRYVARDGRVTWKVRAWTAGRGSSQRSKTFDTHRDALDFCLLVDALGFLGAVAHQARRDKESAAYIPTVAEQVERHLSLLTGITERTRLDYQRLAARTFLPLVGGQRVDDIDRAAVAGVVNALERQRTATGKRTLSAKSIANAHGLFSSVMRSAMLDGYVPGNPCVGVRLPRSGEETRVEARFLTHDEFEQLHEAMAPYWQPLLLTLVNTGMRWSEATAVQVGDVDTTAGTIRVVRAWKRTPGEGLHLGPPKTTRGRRTVTFGLPILEAIRPLLDGPSDRLLFRTPRGGTIHAGPFRDRAWVPALATAGLRDVRIHDLRHTCASWLIAMGVPLEVIQDLLGHENITTTRKIYGHLQPSMRVPLIAAQTQMMAGLRTGFTVPAGGESLPAAPAVTHLIGSS